MPHREKIILSANTSWYLYNFRLPLIKELLKREYKVYALSPKDKYVELLEKMNISHIDIKIKRSGINPLEDILLLAKFVQIYKKYKPDIVQHFTVKPVIYGTTAARITNVRYIYNMVTGRGYVFIGVSFERRFVQVIMRFIYKKG